MDEDTRTDMILIPRTTTLMAACLVAGTILSILPEAQAQKKPKAGGARGQVHKHDPARGFDAGALGAQRDRFEAWKRSVLGGAEYYSMEDRNLRAAHAGLYGMLRSAAIEDRIKDEDLRGLVDELLVIGVKAKEARGVAEALAPEARAQLSSELAALRKKADGHLANTVDRATLTPAVNRLQVGLEEVFRWGVEDGLLSTGQQASLRRKYGALEKKEAAAKDDGEVAERELEHLVEEALELARETGEILRR